MLHTRSQHSKPGLHACLLSIGHCNAIAVLASSAMPHYGRPMGHTDATLMAGVRAGTIQAQHRTR